MNQPIDKTRVAKMTLFFTAFMMLIVIALTSLWLNRVVFDTERFATTTAETFSQESSRESIGNLVADRVFENRPLLRATLSEPLSEYVAAFLATEKAQTGIDRAAREAQLLFTSPRQEPVVLVLAEYKTLIASAQELVRLDETERRLNVDDIPDAITIIDTTKLPNYYAASQYTHIAGPIALIVAIALAGYWLKKGGRANMYQRGRMLLLAVLASSVVALLVGPLFEPIFISIGRDAPSQTLLANFYTTFTEPFRNQALLLFAVAAAVLATLTVWHELTKRYSLSVRITKK